MSNHSIRYFLFLFLAVMPGLACSEMWPQKPIYSFEDCVAAGNTILRTDPPRCVTEDMQTFVRGEAPRRPKPTQKGQPQGGQQQPLPGCKNLCGNGTCEQIVCLSLGCPCPETPQNCPQDCSTNPSNSW